MFILLRIFALLYCKIETSKPVFNFVIVFQCVMVKTRPVFTFRTAISKYKSSRYLIAEILLKLHKFCDWIMWRSLFGNSNAQKYTRPDYRPFYPPPGKTNRSFCLICSRKFAWMSQKFLLQFTGECLSLWKTGPEHTQPVNIKKKTRNGNFRFSRDPTKLS